MYKFFFAVLLSMSCAQSFADGNVESGKRLYAVCAGCHGFLGEGNVEVNSPKLTGQEASYLARQLRYFQQGIRGSAVADVFGRQMAPMSLGLVDERALDDVVAYIQSLPELPTDTTVAGDVQRGQQLYGVCSACHGPRGQGVESLSSPGLAGLDDWYVVNQLTLYASGLRGTHPNDTYGQTMQPIVGMLENEQAIRDLAAFINTLD